jgi:pimeloyl-ACP methyl ester carboxylesterase
MFAETLNEEKGRTDFIQMLLLPDTPAQLKNEILESSRITPLPIGKKIIASMGNNMSYWEKRVVAIPCFAIHSPVYQLTAQYEQDFKKMYPQVQYHEIDGVRHFLMLEIPEVLNALMARFLSKVY